MTTRVDLSLESTVIHLTVAELGRAFRAGTLSPTDVVEEYLRRIGELDPALRAYCAVDHELSRSQAKVAEDELRGGIDRGPMHGVPVAVKDLIFTSDLPTRGGSAIYGDFVPDEDDVVIERLRAGGAVLLGKTNTAEFGFSGNHTTNALLGPTANPWDLDRTTGGSSGGSAAAVSAGLAPIAVASDGGGSIRIPSAFCGTFGHKPTFGLIPLYPGCRDPRFPGFSGWESLEHLGPIARTPLDAALFLDVVAGLDQRDRHSSSWTGPAFADAMHQIDLAGLRIGVTTTWDGHTRVDAAVAEEVLATAQLLADRGATIVADTPEHVATLGAFGTIVAVDAQPSGIAELVAQHPDAVNERILGIVGQPLDATAIGDAQRVRQAIYLSLARYFTQVDLWLTPTVPVTAFRHGDVGPTTIDGEPPSDPYRAIMHFVHLANLTGHPAASLPVATVDDLPVGVQLVGRRFDDATVLGVADVVRAAGRWLPLAPAFVTAGDG